MKKAIIIALASALLCLCACSSEMPQEETSSKEQMSSEQIPQSSEYSSEEISSAEPSEETSEETSEVDNTDKVYTALEYSYKLNNGVATIVGYSGTEESVAVPDSLDGHSVSAIAERAFAGNQAAKSISVGNTAVNIGAGAFAECPVLESVNIGASVAVIDISAFNACPKLSAINVQPGNRSFASENGILYNAEQTAILRCPQAKAFSEELKLAETVKNVGDGAFEKCHGITAISLPQGCAIGKRAFFHCMNLSSVSLGAGIQALPERCFFGCAMLKQIIIPEGVTEIGDYAFFGCVFADTLSLPESLASISDTAFECCPSLKNITVKGDCAKQWYENRKESTQEE